MAKKEQKKIEKLLSLDLSTSCTGYAVFQSGILIAQGSIVPKVKGITKMTYPERQYRRIDDMATKVLELVTELEPDHIVIEEINRGINRIGQKSLDALHFFVIDRLMVVSPEICDMITYYDSNGKKGWRTDLGMKLSAEDKTYNKMAREYNKKNAKAIKGGAMPRRDVVDWKNLAIRLVNEEHGLDLDKKKKGSVDVADAICVGTAFLRKLK